MTLIDKAALVADIERMQKKYSKCPTHNEYMEGLKEGRLIGYKDCLDAVNSAEIRDVDLEKGIEDFICKLYSKTFNSTGTKDDFDWDDIAQVINDTARHFYELGLNTRKEE